MARLALWLTLVSLTAAPAFADVAVEVGVPFTAPELTAALAMRGAPIGDITVRVATRTSVMLWTSAGSQQIELGTAQGADAARLVALQLAPLAIEPALPAPFALAKPTRSAEDHGWVLGATAGGGTGVSSGDLGLMALRADATWARGRWRAGGGIGWLHGSRVVHGPARPHLDDGVPAGSDGTVRFAADLAVLRGVAGLAAGPFELVAGPELVPYRAAGVSSGVMLGAGASLRVVLFARARWQALASTDIDVLQHRVVVESAGQRVASTPRFAITAALGVAWEGL
jgi:hypothetical protein